MSYFLSNESFFEVFIKRSSLSLSFFSRRPKVVHRRPQLGDPGAAAERVFREVRERGVRQFEDAPRYRKVEVSGN
jgi:hypothetical protein